jgi:hypothetical protein
MRVDDYFPLAICGKSCESLVHIGGAEQRAGRLTKHISLISLDSIMEPI